MSKIIKNFFMLSLIMSALNVSYAQFFNEELYVRDVLVGEERMYKHDAFDGDVQNISIDLIGPEEFKRIERRCSGSSCHLIWSFNAFREGEFDGFIRERYTFEDEDGNRQEGEYIFDLAFDVAAPDEEPFCSVDFPGSVISADGRNLKEMIDIVGTEMTLVYSSSRSELYPTSFTNASRVNSYNPEDWSFSPLHYYNKQEESLFLGDGRYQKRPYKIDENGNSMVVLRDEVFIFAPDGRHLETKSRLLGFVKASFSYDVDLKIQKMTNAYGLETFFSRDAAGDLESIVSPFGQVTQIETDPMGRISAVTNPNQETHQITYHDNGLISSFTTPRGLTSTFEFSGAAQLLEARGAGGSLWQLDFVVDGGAQETTVSSQMDRRTVLLTDRDANGKFTRQKVSPSGFVENYSETFEGDQVYSNVFESMQVQSIPDERFIGLDDRIQRRVEVVGDLTRTVEMDQSVELSDLSDPYSYEQLTRTITENGISSTVNFDKNLRELTFTGALGSQREMTLDQFERPISSQVGQDNPIQMSYNAIGKIEQISQNGVPLQSFAYNDEGELSSVTNALNQTTSYIRDAAGRVIEIVSPNQKSILIQYDADGNMTGLRPAERMTHFLEYNLHDLLESYNPPETENFVEVRTSFAYNQDKQLTAIFRPDEDVVNLTYDEVTGLIKSKGGQTYEHYPETDLVKSITSNDQVISEFNYKGTKLLEKETQTIGEDELSLSFDYDNFMRPVVRSIAVDGQLQSSTQTSYDDEGRIANIDGMQIYYEPLSGRVSSTQAGVVTDQRLYDDNGNLQSYEARISGNLIYSYQFERDELQRIIKETEFIQDETNTYEYAYDEMGQLVSVRKNGGAESSYVYDANGNMVSGVMNGSGFSATYNEQDRLINFKAEQSQETDEEQQDETTEQFFSMLEDNAEKKGKAKKSFMEIVKSFFEGSEKSVRKIACGLFNQKGKAKGKGPKFCRNMDEPDDPVNPVTPLTGMGDYFYNASGELIRIEATEGNTVYTRGELGVINSVTLSSGQTITHKTDYDARRVEKLNSSTQNYRRIYQNELQLAAEMNGTELSEFFYAMSINSPDLMKKGGVNYRIIKDHLGSPRLVINTVDGTIMQRMDFNEWGRVLLDTNPGFTPFGFAGGLMDQDTKLVRFGARDYNPSTGRWISKDPIGFNGGDTNLYRYVGNNPVNFTDPTGKIQGIPGTVNISFPNIPSIGKKDDIPEPPTFIEKNLEKLLCVMTDGRCCSGGLKERISCSITDPDPEPEPDSQCTVSQP